MRHWLNSARRSARLLIGIGLLAGIAMALAPSGIAKLVWYLETEKGDAR
jgi:hypothetical protein